MVDEQDRLSDLALKLRRIEKRLWTMRSHLREPGSREELEEIQADEILPVIAHLDSDAGLTLEALRES